jgi:hypothetical protein
VQTERAMAGIALAVAAGSLAAPQQLVRLYGVDPREMTGIGAFGWRLFAMRNVALGVRALRGDEAAISLFGPIQLLDQAVFAHAYRTRSIPRPAAVGAMLTSGAIIALDLARRRRA